MGHSVTLGGDRLGAGKKNKVHLKGFERSTHDKGYLWRSTMAAGTLVPFMKELALPGDTWDINLNCDIKTHPTIGPLFGSYKVQLDVFLAPVRLYNSWLHNNKLNIGRDMSQVKLPIMELTLEDYDRTLITDWNNSQVNPSSLLAYLGIRGIGQRADAVTGDLTRQFNAIPMLAYWDIYKNYYANKQEEIGACIHSSTAGVNETITAFSVGGNTWTLPGNITAQPGDEIIITYSGGTPPELNDIIVTDLNTGTSTSLEGWVDGFSDDGVDTLTMYILQNAPTLIWSNWAYRQATDINQIAPVVETFPLENIDLMRELILQESGGTPFDIADDALAIEPYIWIDQIENGFPSRMNTQELLAIKTYQSDLFNNWLNTEWMDGPGGINEITAVDTSDGNFKIDAIILARKVYDMLNRIAVSGGTYNDWQSAVYDHEPYRQCYSPMYMGGLSKELVFQEVVSNTETAEQPLGTLAGKGQLAQKHKGGHVTIKCDEISYIIGIISLTPRIDYSQGNDWDIHLKTMDDPHKPDLDQIGFQELITEQMAWWDTKWNATTSEWETVSAGKQPAWINYMTSVNKVYGNFAIEDNEMFMTLNRRYERTDSDLGGITDLTTYIDPVKYNQIFAETQLDAQNFWAQISVDATARRKMSAKLMPNL